MGLFLPDPRRDLPGGSGSRTPETAPAQRPGCSGRTGSLPGHSVGLVFLCGGLWVGRHHLIALSSSSEQQALAGGEEREGI